VLFAFPSRYWFTIGRQRVFSLGEWSPQLPTRLHVSGGTQDSASSPISFRLHGSHILWPRFPAGSPSRRIGNSTHAVLQPPIVNNWVWAVPISLAATFGISLIYFPPGTEMVHFPGLAHTRLWIQRAVTGVHPAGFPHSDILGSKPACGSPGLIAACHVLRRLLAPRHPPYALSSLIIKLTQSVFAALECTVFRPAASKQSLTFRFLQLPTSSHRPSARPGMGSRGCRSRPLRSSQETDSRLSTLPSSENRDDNLLPVSLTSHRSGIASHGLE
jgi:hypothetical protein